MGERFLTYAVLGLALLPLQGGLAVSHRGARASPAAALSPISAKLGEEGDRDKATFDKIACWCETNLAEQGRVVDDLSSDITSLGHDLTAQAAGNARLAAELSSHEDELANSQHSLDTVQAIRKNDREKFEETEQSHVQSLDSLDGALQALGRGRAPDLSLSQLRSMASKQLKGHKSSALLLQLKSSPEVVYGVVQQMKETFSKDLEEMRSTEATASERHEGLVDAKAQEIAALKHQVMEKKSRLAKSKVQSSNRAQQKDRMEKLLEADQAALAAIRDFCSGNEQSFQVRQEARQAELVAISSAQAEIAGAQLLSLHAGHKARGFGNGADALCNVALEITEKAWKAKAKDACAKARAGSSQDAADVAETLAGELRTAQQDAKREHDDCSQSIEDAKRESADGLQAADAEAGEINSDKSTADSSIEAMNQQSAWADKAKSDLAEKRSAQHGVLQNIRQTSVHAVELMHKAANAAGGSAASKLNEAIAQSEKTSDAAGSYDSQAASDLQKVSGLLDQVRLAAGKALIPLKLARADAEEDIIGNRQEQRSLEHAAQPRCDVASLAAKTKKIEGYVSMLGDAAESLAYDALR